MAPPRESHIITLPYLSCQRPPSDSAGPLDVSKQVEEYLEHFNALISDGNQQSLESAFHKDGWLRDNITLSWDIRAIHGSQRISKYIGINARRTGLSNLVLRRSGSIVPSVVTKSPRIQWMEAMFDFKTALGHGSGVVRLVKEFNSRVVAFMMSFSLQFLHGHEEKTNLNRPLEIPVPIAHGRQQDWKAHRDKERLFLNCSPDVLIVGAGHSGLMIAARLSQMGLTALIIDRKNRVGDSWRHRYRTLVTHAPVQYTHMPYMPFPSTWPVFTSKDKLADFLESYALLLDLNVWTNTIIHKATYNKNDTWNITLMAKDGTFREICPQHVVLATGQSSEISADLFPSKESFKGEAYHASEHKDASNFGDLTHKRVLVVGSGTAAHDICQDFYENGADVTMLQRGGTCVISKEVNLAIFTKGLYEDYGPPTEDADIYLQGMPNPVNFALQAIAMKKIISDDKARLDGLANAGFKVDFGEDGSGMYRKFITRGGGYYIDIGCSQLIIDRKVKVRQSTIADFAEDGVRLADGSFLASDIICFATGYKSMRVTACKILGDEIGSQLREVWDLDNEGEIRAMWRYSGHPRLWYTGGTLAQSRSYSKLLALQICAYQDGKYIVPQEDA